MLFFFSGILSANLTTEPAPLEGELCPTVVQFTCIIEDLSVLRWFINDSNIFSYYVTDTFPSILSPSVPGIEISVTAATSDNGNNDLFDATSTLTTNTTLLQAFNMQDFTCGSTMTRSEPVTVNFNILGKYSVAFP